MLCDTATGYNYALKPYCGVYASLLDTVTGLMGDGLLDQGYHLYMDNFYNSPDMCSLLLSRDTHVCGTLRTCRRAPLAIKQATTSTLKKGERLMRHNGEAMMLAWHENKPKKKENSPHDQHTARGHIGRGAGEAEGVQGEADSDQTTVCP